MECSSNVLALPLNLTYTGAWSLVWPDGVKVNNVVAVAVVSTVRSVPTTMLFPAAFHMFWHTSPKSRRTRIPLWKQKMKNESKLLEIYRYDSFWN